MLPGDRARAFSTGTEGKMAEREGFEPFCRLEVKSLENDDLFEG
jgi:hypothetical protein